MFLKYDFLPQGFCPCKIWTTCRSSSRAVNDAMFKVRMISRQYRIGYPLCHWYGKSGACCLPRWVISLTLLVPAPNFFQTLSEYFLGNEDYRSPPTLNAKMSPQYITLTHLYLNTELIKIQFISPSPALIYSIKYSKFQGYSYGELWIVDMLSTSLTSLMWNKFVLAVNIWNACDM